MEIMHNCEEKTLTNGVNTISYLYKELDTLSRFWMCICGDTHEDETMEEFHLNEGTATTKRYVLMVFPCNGAELIEYYGSTDHSWSNSLEFESFKDGFNEIARTYNKEV